MNGCHDFQELLLDSLYGVLEPAEEQALRAHVEQCGGCKEAFAEVRQQQSLLARAARACPDVTPFVLPTETIHEPQEEPARFEEVEVAPVAATIRPRRFRRVAILAAAAAILLAAGFLGNQYRLQLHEHEAELGLAQNQVKATDALLAQAQADFRREKDRIPDAAEKKALHVQVVGPARLTPDAPTPVLVVTRDLSGQKVASRLTAKLVAGGKELHRQDVASQGDRGIVLPAGMFEKVADAKLLVSARSPDGMAEVEEAVRLEMPAHVAHLATNKSIYQLGEVLFFRVLALESFSLKPPAQPVNVDVSLVDPAGKPAKRLSLATAAGGIAAGELALTPELVSGNYVLEVKGANVTSVRRPLELVRDLPPQLQFDRPEYRPGETFSAQYQGRRGPDGKAMPIEDLKVKILVDGKEVKVESTAPAAPGAPGGAPPPSATLGAAGNLSTDARGNLAIRAKLPVEIETGKALVEIQARSGQQRDKLVQSIPVVGSRLAVDFFPEGGNLVAGVPNRVYYRVRTPLGEPVDPEGYVIILSKKDVVLASERNQGLGVFTFTPDARDSYTLRVTSARGISETVDPFNKLGILAKGIVLHVPDAVSDEAKPLRLVLHNTDEDKPILVVATCRGRIVAQDLFDARKGTSEAKLDLVPGTRGVVRVTVYETGAGLTPIAERLVYRAAAEKLILSAEAGKKSQRPGDSVTMKVGAKDEKGKETPAWLLAAVVAERALGALDRHALSPEASFYLMSAGEQPQDLENADVLLAESDLARQSLDLYLGSQGWRRFVPAAPAAVVAARDDASTTQPPILFSRENASLATLQAQSAQSAQQELARLRRDHLQKLTALEAERAGQVEVATAAARRLAELKNRPVELARLGLGILILLLLAAGAVGLAIGFVRLLRQQTSPTTAFATACGCLLACLLIYGAAGSLPGTAPLPGRIELADKGRQGLEEETQRTWTQQKSKTQSPQGVFALAPPAQPSGGFGGARQFGEQRSLQNEAKNSLAKADAQDRNRDGVAAPQISSAMKSRFAEAERAHDKTGDYASKKKTAGAANGKGEASATFLREYAHRNSPKPASEGTLLWHPALFAPNGQAQLSFDLPPIPATYRILLYGHDANGRLGALVEKLPAK